MFAFWMVRMMMACTVFRSAVGAMGALIGATFALFFIAAQFHKSAEKHSPTRIAMIMVDRYSIKTPTPYLFLTNLAPAISV